MHKRALKRERNEPGREQHRSQARTGPLRNLFKRSRSTEAEARGALLWGPVSARQLLDAVEERRLGSGCHRNAEARIPTTRSISPLEGHSPSVAPDAHRPGGGAERGGASGSSVPQHLERESAGQTAGAPTPPLSLRPGPPPVT